MNYIDYVYDIPVRTGYGIFSKGVKKKDYRSFRNKQLSFNELQKAILTESSNSVLKYISEHLDLSKYYNHIIFSTSKKSFIDNIDFNNVRAIINFKSINGIRHINKHFESVNKLLPDAGIYIGRLKTYHVQRLMLYRKYGKPLGRVIWLADFLLNRVPPKIRGLNKIYNFFTRGKIHRLSEAETLGRLVYSGFEIIEFSIIEDDFYFVSMKTSEPTYDKTPTYYPLIKLNRVGKEGKMIKVFKFRTMYPYSEYLQDFVLKLYGYNKVGKPANDFRVAGWGKLIRKVWLDEIPQFINVLRGEMKLVGVRPLSKVRFNQLPLDVQKERINYKPGCFPPYVALNMPDDKGNIEAERIYFKDLRQFPLTTNIKYFYKAFTNIIFNKIRSS